MCFMFGFSCTNGGYKCYVNRVAGLVNLGAFHSCYLSGEFLCIFV